MGRINSGLFGPVQKGGFMFAAFKNLDRVLRGEATRLEDLRAGHLDVPARGLAVAAVLLGAFYGACMGSYGVVTGKEGAWLQIVSAMVKVPLLFVLTLVVTFPSLYVFNALVGSRLSFLSMLRLLVAGVAVMMALLASFGTIVAFFGFTSTSYNFMKLLNVLVFAVSGLLGLSFLLQTLHRLTVSMEKENEDQNEEAGRVVHTAPPPPVPPTTEAAAAHAGPDVPPHPDQAAQHVNVRPVSRRPGALDRSTPGQVGSRVKAVFNIWLVVFGLVGAQMSWILRPFIGSGEFTLFRERSGNFFESVWTSIQLLFQG